MAFAVPFSSCRPWNTVLEAPLRATVKSGTFAVKFLLWVMPRPVACTVTA